MDILTLIKSFQRRINKFFHWIFKAFGHDQIKIVEQSFNLDQVKSFLEEYIGVVITGFDSYHVNILDLEKYIQAKIISRVDLDKNFIYLKLSNLDGTNAGCIKMVPASSGKFIEIDDEDEDVIDDVKFRIIFFGGSSFFYADDSDISSVSYSPKHRV